MKKLTITQYAVKHGLTIHQVVKLVKSGKLETVTTKEGDREKTYILSEKNPQETKSAPSLPSQPTLEERLSALETEVARLKEKLENLTKKR